MRSHRLVPLLAAATLAAVAALGLAPTAAQAADPPVVSLPGSFNQSLGCASDWAPDCAQLQLDYDAASGVYTRQLDIAPGDYQFKIAQDGSWDVNYGQDGAANGANINFTAGSQPTVFVYDPVSHLVQAAPAGQLVTLPGSYQSEVGCPGDWQPDCLASTMYPLSDGTYTYSTDRLPQNSWEVKVAVGLSWDVNYGRDGAAGGANYEFVTAAGELTTFTYTPSDHKLAIDVTNPPLPGTGQFQAIWLDRDTIAWPPALVGDPAALDYALTGHLELALTADGQVTADQASHNELTQGYLALKVTAAGGGQPSLAVLEAALQGPLEVVASRDGEPVAQTGAQLGDVLDDLYGAAAQDEALGTTWSDGVPTLKLWAPTATAVALELWTDDPAGQPTVVAASRAADGVWTVAGQPGWKNAQYLWSVEVYAPSVDQVVTNHVTDPYATALTVDSTRGVLIDLDDPAWAPGLWADTPIPAALRTQAEQTIYELHIRDFSAADSTVPEAERGTYKAFTRFQSDGMTHLAELADAGLTTVHLLPSFDIATIPELRADQATPNIPADAAADSPDQQAAVAAVADQDAYNWGYDPWHWSSPEGSYATADAQDGGARTAQFREMVGGLHSLGLRVVLDEVFNHTSASGQDPKSVLDQIVPGYYQRLSATGAVETSTCCQNVATENVMAGKMMVDSVVTWVKYYHVDGFRFDIMGHHSLQNMIDVRAALDG
ncbi:MAG: DUF3372 domain-containing protein, partial [Propionibacteriaceae bacterium]|nr:DUF3372 domain-containing protein [Propionibacteriaceae bacterium]